VEWLKERKERRGKKEKKRKERKEDEEVGGERVEEVVVMMITNKHHITFNIPIRLDTLQLHLLSQLQNRNL
jgi:hypothetical protein